MTTTPPQSIADALDKLLLDIIENGREVGDGNGGTIRTTATAKDLEVAMKRLEQLGALDPARSGTPAGELVKQRERVSKHLQKLKIAGGMDAPPPLEETA